MNARPYAFTLRQLQYAVAIAETLSFRKAAELCHVSQPSLSAQLAQLEDALGTRLFERTQRKVMPTVAGGELIARARALLVQTDELHDAAQRVADPLSGTMRIGIIPTLSPYLLPAIAPPLRRRFPKLDLLWNEDRTESLRRALEEGELDAALLAREAALGDVELEVIGQDPFLLAAPAQHPLAKKAEPLHLADLKSADVLVLQEGHCLGDQTLALCSRARAHELEFRATSLPTLVQMVASGAGVTLLPELAAATEARNANLKLRRFAEPSPHRTVVLIWRKTSPLKRGFKEIAGVIREAIPLRSRG